MTLFRNMALRWKLVLAFSTIVLLSGTVAFVALTIHSQIRIDIAQIRQAATSLEADINRRSNDADEVSPVVDDADKTSLKIQVESEVHNIESLVQRANAILLSFVLLIPAISCFLTWFIYRGISHSIAALKNYAQGIGEGDFNTTVKLRSQDEFGPLAISALICLGQDMSETKRTARDLEAARQLLETSRQAGMAEVATSILHNVGNVLNSVNVSAGLILDKVQKSRVSGLSRAVALMEAHGSDLPGFFDKNPKGMQLLGYLSKLDVNLTHEQKSILDEVHTLLGNILHIKEIVAMQQNFARVSGIVESLNIVDLIEDAVRFNSGSMERHQIKLIRDFSEMEPLSLDKHKVLQILVNLIRNAKHAFDDSGVNDKQITLRVTNENERIKISIIDNGIGIPAENMTRIFNHGFTTRKDGHGFGLHSGALAAKEIGGSLTASSEGSGRGSSFTLELPMTEGRRYAHQSS